MSSIDRKFTKDTKDYGELQTGSSQVWYDFEPANEESKALVVRFLDEIGMSYPTKGGQRKLVLAMSDVIMATRHAQNGLIIWPMDNSYFTGAPYGADFARLVLNRLIDTKYVCLVQKSSKWDKLARLYRVTLPDYIAEASFRTHGLGPVIEVRSSRWRDSKGKSVGGRRLSLNNFEESEVSRIQKNARSINQTMERYPLVHSSGQVFMRCRRIFNEGSLQKGGRYYGGWQNFTEKERLQMTIGGSTLVEIDLKACFLVIMARLYNIGKPRDAQTTLPFDPYSLLLFVRECNDDDRRKQMRDLAKLLVSCVLSKTADPCRFPNGKKTVVDPITGRTKTISVRDQFELDKHVKASNLYGQIHQTFPFISEMDVRIFDLMYLESEIIGTTMYKLAVESDIPTYPVHDCLMCREEDVERVLQEIVKTANELLGAPIPLDVTFSDGSTETYQVDGSELTKFVQPTSSKKYRYDWGIIEELDVELFEEYT